MVQTLRVKDKKKRASGKLSFRKYLTRWL